MPWQIDTARTHVGFSMRHMMVSTIRGQFTSYQGKCDIVSTAFTRSNFEGHVEVASIDTGKPDRDDYLRTSDLLAASKHPRIQFRSSRIEPTGDQTFVVAGQMSIRGVTRPVSFDVELHGVSKDLYGRELTGLTARGRISRKDFGVNSDAVFDIGGLALGDSVEVEVELGAVFVAEAVAARAA
jgi:polyisoprenoid-binding protein YceI